MALGFRCLLLIVGAMLASSASHALAGFAPPQTPEEAVAQLVAASRAGDVDAALELTAEPFRTPLQQVILMEEAEDLKQAAIHARFGPQRRYGFRMEEKRRLLGLKSAEVLDATNRADGTILLTVRETLENLGSCDRTATVDAELPYVAIREGGCWKLLRPTMTLYFVHGKADRAVRRLDDGTEIEVALMKFDVDLIDLGREWKALCESTAGGPHESLSRLRWAKGETARIAAEVVAGKYETLNEALAEFHSISRKAEGAVEAPKPGVVSVRERR